MRGRHVLSVQKFRLIHKKTVMKCQSYSELAVLCHLKVWLRPVTGK